MHLDHVVVFVADAERSLAFYGDALGLAMIMDREFDGPWPELFGGVTSPRLRAMILGDPEHPDRGQVELLTFAEPVDAGPGVQPVATGTVMLSFMVDLADVLPRLVAAGGTDVRRAALKNGVDVVTLRDPDGTLVELLNASRSAGRETE
ncbi:MAG TPA: VOC family protein [Mycobacteriales bacterium]|jgi:catechol 2,3-dioxygenase-like lactoylglutathione lyase family enzyme|nr:VOC family protein [Mycobacteriales bacterium]